MSAFRKDMNAENPALSYLDEAIPHEAGHLIVGKAVGLPARGLDFNVTRLPDGRIAIGDFATLVYSPPDEEIPNMEKKLKASLMLLTAGGVAGNIYVGQKVGQGADADRKELARLTNKPLEELAEMAQPIIHKRRDAFRQLMSRIKEAFLEKLNDPTLQTGRHNLLTEQDLEAIYYEKQPDAPVQAVDPSKVAMGASLATNPMGTYIDEAIAHESGHIVVANECGITVHEMYVMLTRGERGYEVGDFATESEDPSNEQIAEMNEALKTGFALFVAGGVAGNKFDGLNQITEGAASDREELERFTDRSLEEVSEDALLIVTEQRRRFRRIKSVARQRFQDLVKDSSLQTGRHTLLNEADLQGIFNKK